jgi:hypothetical protein
VDFYYYCDERYFLADKLMLYVVALGKANIKLPNNKYLLKGSLSKFDYSTLTLKRKIP